MMILFDRFLGITHFNKQGGEAGPFQDEMCDYMPEPHRQLLQDFSAKLVRILELCRCSTNSDAPRHTRDTG